MEEKDLSEHARALWVKSRHAIELRNYEYALALVNAVLKQFPEFLAGRNRLREIELRCRVMCPCRRRERRDRNERRARAKLLEDPSTHRSTP